MSDITEDVLKILNDFGGESSMFLITNPDSPWAKLGDSAALKSAVEALASAGKVAYNAGSDVVKAS